MKPVIARAEFCETESLSAGRERSPRPAMTRPHFIMGAQKKTESDGLRSTIPVLGPAGWFQKAANLLAAAMTYVCECERGYDKPHEARDGRRWLCSTPLLSLIHI